MSSTTDQPLLLYDAHCGFCLGLTTWLQAFPKGKKLVYLPLQSKEGQKILEQFGFVKDYRDSLVLTWRGEALIEGKALRILVGLLPLGWFWQAGLRLCPLSLINWVYRTIAKHRSTTTCKTKEA